MTVDKEGQDAVLEALRIEATDNTFPDAWQQGVRYAISEVRDALESARSAEPVAWVEPCDIAALGRIKGVRGGTRIAALKAFPHTGDVALYLAHPTPETTP